MYTSDTIAGIATASGLGGIAIIRVSGDKAQYIMNSVFKKSSHKEIESHYMYHGFLYDGNKNLDECMAVIMKAPKSYTKEDVFELHTHGGHAAAYQALNLILSKGARLAEAGEFTKRAFLNGRIDLSQAEAVMAMISANGESSLRAASQQLEGMQSKFIQNAKNTLIKALSGIEATIDFPEEIEDSEAIGELLPTLLELYKALNEAIDERAARIVRDGLSLVLCGNPNAGKSSLFNALLNRDQAIVTDMPGTTRDLIQASINLNGILINLTDTAGIRDTVDAIESIGVKKAVDVMKHADVIMYILDGSLALTEYDFSFISDIDKPDNAIVINKEDLPSLVNINDLKGIVKQATILQSSTINIKGIDEVKNFIIQKSVLPKTLMLTHTRHVQATKQAIQNVESAITACKSNSPVELIAVDLKEAMHNLGEILGEYISDELVDNIFSNFCVGK